ncbi:hypothetical protein AK812_SmicGene10803 [Symbiodinium microadriaticum]|uniref:Uncharacterized protein n=1 Tax=Symbiodinium microadriaticum TaxID=2951 RepID=A0A1Q9EEZ1_SYMMI|nr:hypothetical protein AK812_SmicGene10803 [Symbiodinium microadriaticum]
MDQEVLSGNAARRSALSPATCLKQQSHHFRIFQSKTPCQRAPVYWCALQAVTSQVDTGTVEHRLEPIPAHVSSPALQGNYRQKSADSTYGWSRLKVSSREAVEASLGSLHEAAAQCKMVLSHMEFLLEASTQALALQEPSLRNDRRPQSAPSHALQLQKQLAAKVQEARVLVRDSAALAMQCLRSHGARGGYAASAPMPPQPETPQPAPQQPEPQQQESPVAEPPQPEPPQTEMLQAKPAAASRADMPMATVLECKVQDTPSADGDAEPPRTTTNCKPALEQEKPFWSQLGGVHWDEVEVLAAQWSP